MPNKKQFICIGVLCSLAVVALLAALPAAAQQTPGKKAPPKSFSDKKPEDHASAPKKDVPLSDEEVADAIMGSALAGVYDESDEHYHKGEYNHAIALNRFVEQGDPHNVETYSNAAYLLWSTDRNAEAIEQLKLGIAAVPNSSYMYDELGTHYWIHLHDAVSAIPYLEKAIQFKCGWTTYHNLANCYQKLGKWDKAVATWREATKFGDDIRAKEMLKRAEAHLATQGNH